MSSLTLRGSWKIFTKLSAPIQVLLANVLIMLLMEFIKFCIILLLMFAFSYLIFRLWNTNNAEVGGLKSECLSAGLIENGSFSKFPYVVEFPTKASAESLKEALKKLKSN